ncbi:MAG: hypothetical protein ACXWC1_26795 [Burkholderiales bacterium]
MDDLRSRLNQITQNGKPETHPEMIHELRRTHQHSIEITEGPAAYDRYTCVMHAFELVEDPEYIDIAQAAPADIFASPRFVDRLIERRDLVELPGPTQGALVVYLDNDAVRHIGRLLSDSRVESKWGIGLLYQHDLFEVPSSYGSVVRFFKPIDREYALDRYVDYARENGVRFEGDA